MSYWSVPIKRYFKTFQRKNTFRLRIVFGNLKNLATATRKSLKKVAGNIKVNAKSSKIFNKGVRFGHVLLRKALHDQKEVSLY